MKKLLAVLMSVCMSAVITIVAVILVCFGLSGGTGSREALTAVAVTSAFAGALQPIYQYYFGSAR